jgi:hypothetical protein
MAPQREGGEEIGTASHLGQATSAAAAAAARGKGISSKQIGLREANHWGRRLGFLCWAEC